MGMFFLILISALLYSELFKMLNRIGATPNDVPGGYIIG